MKVFFRSTNVLQTLKFLVLDVLMMIGEPVRGMMKSLKMTLEMTQHLMEGGCREGQQFQGVTT